MRPCQKIAFIVRCGGVATGYCTHGNHKNSSWCFLKKKKNLATEREECRKRGKKELFPSSQIVIYISKEEVVYSKWCCWRESKNFAPNQGCI